MEIQNLSRSAVLSTHGYWSTPTNEKISYTENGHVLIESSEDNSFWYQHRLNCLNEVLKQYPIEGLLDIGGGNGQIAKFIQDKNIDVVLLEPMIAGVQNAQKNGVKKIIWGSLHSTAIKEKSVPAVGLFDVLEHQEDDAHVLQQISRALKENGILYLTVPAFQFLYSQFDTEVGHYRRYNLNQLTSLLSDNGFKINYKSYLFSIMPAFIWPVRRFYTLFKKDRTRRQIGHIRKKSILGHLLNWLLSLELYLIRKKVSIPFGSTCLIIACKKN